MQILSTIKLMPALATIVFTNYLSLKCRGYTWIKPFPYWVQRVFNMGGKGEQCREKLDQGCRVPPNRASSSPYYDIWIQFARCFQFIRRQHQ